MRSGVGSPFRLQLLRNPAPLSQQHALAFRLSLDFRSAMFHSPSYSRSASSTTNHGFMPMALVSPHSTLSGCRYRVELSIDPGFLQVPVSPAFALIPSRVPRRSEAFLCGTRCALSIRPAAGLQPAFTCNQVAKPFPAWRRFMVAQLLFTLLPVLAGHHFAIERDVRLGRRGELHPPAPSVAAPARLEACGFSVCLVQDLAILYLSVWRTDVPFGSVFAVGGLH